MTSGTNIQPGNRLPGKTLGFHWDMKMNLDALKDTDCDAPIQEVDARYAPIFNRMITTQHF